MKKSQLALTLMMSVMMATCASRPLGDVLSIENVVGRGAPPTCVADPSSTVVLSRGVRDIAKRKLTEYGYIAAVRMRNLTDPSKTQSGVIFGPYDNMFINNTDVLIDGVNLCYETERTGDSLPKDPAASCESLRSAPKAFSGGAGLVAASSRGVSTVDLFPQDVVGALGLDVADGQQKTVFVHVQATGRLSDGATVRSNEMVYPITICNGCLYPRNPTTGQLVSCTADLTSICTEGQDSNVPCAAQTPATPTRNEE